jgi:hypothetical protein
MSDPEWDSDAGIQIASALRCVSLTCDFRHGCSAQQETPPAHMLAFIAEQFRIDYDHVATPGDSGRP